MKIRNHKTFDAFAKHLRIHYRTCIQEVTEINLNYRQSSGSWTTNDGAVNMAGKRGVKHLNPIALQPLL